MGKFKVKVDTEPKIRIGGPRTYRPGGPLARYGNAGLGDLGELNVYPAVLRFQKVYNITYEDSQSYESPIRLTGGTIEEDGKYGSRETQPAMERYVNLLVRIGLCGGTSSYDVRTNGPTVARTCLLGMSFTAPEIRELQQAWIEMQGRLAPAPDGGGGAPPIGPPEEGGGDGRPDPDVDVPRRDMPAPEPAPDAGVFGLILFGVDVVGGTLLAWAFGRK